MQCHPPRKRGCRPNHPQKRRARGDHVRPHEHRQQEDADDIGVVAHQQEHRRADEDHWQPPPGERQFQQEEVQTPVLHDSAACFHEVGHAQGRVLRHQVFRRCHRIQPRDPESNHRKRGKAEKLVNAVRMEDKQQDECDGRESQQRPESVEYDTDFQPNRAERIGDIRQRMAHLQIFPAQKPLCRANQPQRQRYGQTVEQHVQEQIRRERLHDERIVGCQKAAGVAEPKLHVYRRNQPEEQLQEELDELRQNRSEGNQQHDAPVCADGVPRDSAVFLGSTHGHLSFTLLSVRRFLLLPAYQYHPARAAGSAAAKSGDDGASDGRLCGNLCWRSARCVYLLSWCRVAPIWRDTAQVLERAAWRRV